MTNKSCERRLFNCEFRSGKDDNKNKITGYGALFNSMSENLGGFREIISPGAFDDVLDNDVRALINHDSNLILGRTRSGTLTLSVDENGLKYEIDMPDTTYARDLQVSMFRGDVSQSSFGFNIESDDWNEDEEGRLIRTINKFSRLHDVSPVTYPAYPETSVALRSLESYKETISNSTKIENETRERELFLMMI